MAHAFETKLDPRVFILPAARGRRRANILPQASTNWARSPSCATASDLTFGLEIEANLVGHTGGLLAEIHRQVNHPAHGAGVRRREYPARASTGPRCFSPISAR